MNVTKVSKSELIKGSFEEILYIQLSNWKQACFNLMFFKEINFSQTNTNSFFFTQYISYTVSATQFLEFFTRRRNLHDLIKLKTL